MNKQQARLIFGLDLGQSVDYTALAAVEVQPTSQEIEHLGTRFGKPASLKSTVIGPPTHTRLRQLVRYPQRMPYPKIVQSVIALMRKAPGEVTLVVDHTGVGRGITDMFRAAGVRLIAVTITGGSAVGVDAVPLGLDVRLPKRMLVYALLVAFQEERFKYARDMPDIELLLSELQAFHMKINPETGHDSYEAWRESEHDDLVLATALAVWFGEEDVRQQYEAALAVIEEQELDAAMPPPRISAY